MKLRMCVCACDRGGRRQAAGGTGLRGERGSRGRAGVPKKGEGRGWDGGWTIGFNECWVVGRVSAIILSRHQLQVKPID